MAAQDPFPSRLHRYRSLAGLTQKELSAASGVSVPQIARYERGESKPRMRSVAKLAEPLGVTVEDLIGQSAIGEWGVQIVVNRDDGASSLSMSLPRLVAQRLREIAETDEWNLTAFHVALLMAACREKRELSDEDLAELYSLAKAGVGLGAGDPARGE